MGSRHIIVLIRQDLYPIADLMHLGAPLGALGNYQDGFASKGYVAG